MRWQTIFIGGVAGLLLAASLFRPAETSRVAEPGLSVLAGDSTAGGPRTRPLPAARPRDPLDRVLPSTRAPLGGELPGEGGSELDPAPELAGLLVRLVPVGPLPEIDVLSEVVVQLWEFEPLHLRDPGRDPWFDPEPLEDYGEEVEEGILFEQAPRDRPLWISASGLYWPTEIDGFVPAIRSVPAPREGRWSVELRVATTGWLSGRVVGVDEDHDWRVLCEQTGELVERGDADSFRFWPVPAGPLNLTLTIEEPGRIHRQRHRFVAPRSGGYEVGALSPRVGRGDLLGTVKLEGGQSIQTELELCAEVEPALSFETDADGCFRIGGDLEGLTTLRVQPPDLYAYEAVTIDLRRHRSRCLDVLLPRRPERLLDAVISPRLAGGEYVEGDLVMVLGRGRDAVAKFGMNHRGYCGAGIFTMYRVPPGELDYVAWIPDEGLSGDGLLQLVPADSGSEASGNSFDGRPILRPVLREAGTVVTGELVVLPGVNPPGMLVGAQSFVSLRGDPRTEVRLDWIAPGRFSLEGLPADCDLQLELRNQPERTLIELDLRLGRFEELELGAVVVGPR